jgi:hypothetical protein
MEIIGEIPSTACRTGIIAKAPATVAVKWPLSRDVPGWLPEMTLFGAASGYGSTHMEGEKENQGLSYTGDAPEGRQNGGLIHEGFPADSGLVLAWFWPSLCSELRS